MCRASQLELIDIYHSCLQIELVYQTILLMSFYNGGQWVKTFLRPAEDFFTARPQVAEIVSWAEKRR